MFIEEAQLITAYYMLLLSNPSPSQGLNYPHKQCKPSASYLKTRYRAVHSVITLTTRSEDVCWTLFGKSALERASVLTLLRFGCISSV